ncbi:S10 family serine carboxypeptidase-like protein [Phyllobacterium sp. P5_D12]
MNYKYLLLISALALAACNGSNSSTDGTSTFDADASKNEALANAKAITDKANAEAAATRANAQASATVIIDDAKKASEADKSAAQLALDEEIASARQQKLKALDIELTSQKSKRIADIEGELTGLKESRTAKLGQEIEALRPGKLEALDGEIAALKLKRLGELEVDLTTETDGRRAEKVTALDNEIAGLRLKRTGELENEITTLRGEKTGDVDTKIAALRIDKAEALDGENAALRLKRTGELEAELAKEIDVQRARKTGDLDKEMAALKETGTKTIENDLAELKIAKTAVINDEIAALRTTKLDDLDKELAALKAQKGAALDDEMAALKLSETKKITEELALLKAAGLAREGNSAAAADVLKQAGVSGELGTILAEGGFEDAAFDVLAPQDNELKDPNIYNTGISGSIQPASVIETASAMRHSMKIDSQTVKFTARAGHLIAKGDDDTRAAIFYTAYTRDGLPHDKRPVTFFWNGGPGSPSIWLHFGSWGPKRLKSDAPNIPEKYYTNQPTSFPLEENAVTLLDKTDLVFVDPPGTGLSTAIAPSTNQTFWGVDVDTKVVAGFVAAYTNRYNRQSSPKYLYGESYGGIRTPIVADILLKAGTGAYDPDISGKPTKVLNGIILNSPILDYLQNCDHNSDRPVKIASATCASFLPSYAMTANFFNLPQAHNITSREAYLRSMTDFTVNSYMPILAKYPGRPTSTEFPTPWVKFSIGAEGKSLFNELYAKTGISSGYWKDHLSLLPSEFTKQLIPGRMLGRYDARMALPNSSKYSADKYIDIAYENEMKTHLPDFVNYKTSSTYAIRSDEAIGNWAWSHRGSAGIASPASTADLMEALAYNPSLKLLVLHGYEDVATPGFRTELDLKALVYRAGAKGVPALTMLDRTPVKWFEGGHMTYNTEESRQPLKAALNQYYDDPGYSIPVPATVSN